MKKRIISILLLSFMMVSLVAPVAPIHGASNNSKTEFITVQKESMEERNVIIYEDLQSEEYEIKNDFDIAVEEMNQQMSEIELIQDKKEWFIAYKSIIDEYSYILDPPETIYDYFTNEELVLLVRVVKAEIGDEYSFEQKCNVASVIFNRLEHEDFKNELLEILTEDQFETIRNGRYKKVTISEDTILAVEYAFQIEDTTNGSLFFDSNNTLKYEFVFNDMAHNFYKLREENTDE